MAKLVAVFLMCIIVVAAKHIHKAEATNEGQFKECYTTCHKECFQDGKANGYTFCEMKCGDDCNTKGIQVDPKMVMHTKVEERKLGGTPIMNPEGRDEDTCYGQCVIDCTTPWGGTNLSCVTECQRHCPQPPPQK